MPRDTRTEAHSIPEALGGEADPNTWYFGRAGEAGPLPNPVGHTFPLLTHDADARWRLVGTGFYVSGDGLFVTARHVIEEVFRDDRQVLPLVILHPRSDTGLWGPSEVLLRPIMQCWLGDADVALGVAATATNNQTGEVLSHWSWPLSWTVPADASPVATYAFPNHSVSDDGREFFFHPDAYQGTLQGSGDFRDRVMAPHPYLQVDFRIHGAASGGPIFGSGRVIGVNCTELTASLDAPPGPAFGAQIRCLKDAFIEDAALFGEEGLRRVTFDELVRANAISVDEYVPRKHEDSLSGSVVRLDMPVRAPTPRVSFSVYT